MKRKYIIWSYCDDQQQTFCDIVVATSVKAAKRLWVKKRGDYATIDLYAEPQLLADYIATLHRAETSSDEEVMAWWSTL